MIYFFFTFFPFPAQFVRRGFTLNDLLDNKPSGVTDVFRSPPRYLPSFLLRIGFSIPTLSYESTSFSRRFSWNYVRRLHIMGFKQG